VTRVYRAEDRANRRYTGRLPALDGTQRQAQAYVDRITRSAWWSRTCPPSWRGDDTTPNFEPADESRPPRRVIVRVHNRGSGAWASTYEKRRHRGRWFPIISLGAGLRGSLLPCSADPWVILHELTHIIVADTDPGHGVVFARTYVAAVRRWLGADAARVLREELKAEGMPIRRPARAAKR